MTPGILTSIAHMAPVAGRAIEFNLTIIVIASAALAVVAISVWAPPILAGTRSGSALLTGGSSVREHSAQRMRIFPRPPSALLINICFGVLSLGVVGFVAYLTRHVPVQLPVIEGSAAHRYWPAAAAAAAVVVIVAAATVALATRRAHRRPAGASAGDARPRAELRFEFVPGRIIGISAAASATALVLCLAAGFPLWSVALAAGIPWVPAVTLESARKFDHYGLYAFLLIVAGLQAGHVGEHGTQVTQLLMTNGDLARSHGVFGQLDFETVHFFWDTGVWLSAGLLVSRFYGSKWLWVSFAAASLHEVEHIYLYWLYLFHQDFYMQGGLAGIMGRGGVIGSPLYRPYLHFLYNAAVAIPMLIALFEQACPRATSMTRRR